MSSDEKLQTQSYAGLYTGAGYRYHGTSMRHEPKQVKRLTMSYSAMHTTSDRKREQPPPPICTRARLEGQIAVHARVTARLQVQFHHAY